MFLLYTIRKLVKHVHIFSQPFIAIFLVDKYIHSLSSLHWRHLTLHSMMNHPPILCFWTQKCMKGIPFWYGGRHLHILFLIFMHILSPKPSLYAFQETHLSCNCSFLSGFVLVIINKFVANIFDSKWRIHRIPCPIPDESIMLLLHGFFQFIMKSYLLKGICFNAIDKFNSKSCEISM